MAWVLGYAWLARRRGVRDGADAPPTPARVGADRLVRHARAGDAGDGFRAPGRLSRARPDRADRLRRRARDARRPGADPRAAGPPARPRRRRRRRGGRARPGARGARRGGARAPSTGKSGAAAEHWRYSFEADARRLEPARRSAPRCAPSARSASPRSAASASGWRSCARCTASGPRPSWCSRRSSIFWRSR